MPLNIVADLFLALLCLIDIALEIKCIVLNFLFVSVTVNA